jgi:carboxymethylenebutenolidase
MNDRLDHTVPLADGQQMGALLRRPASGSGLDGVAGGAGILGFCLGGALAYHVASTTEPDTCVSYYGSAIPDALDALDGITCPILFHFGEQDQYTPVERVDAVEAAVAGRGNVRFERYPSGGHAFDNAWSERFHQPRNAVTAWGVTAQFRGAHPAGRLIAGRRALRPVSG